MLSLYLLPELASDVAKPLHPIEAHRLEAAVAQHLGHLEITNSLEGKT